MKIRNGILCGLILAVAIGCTTTTDWPDFSGFLNNYKGMYRSSEIEGIFLIKHRTKNMTDYSKFLVDPVVVQLTPDAVAYNINKVQLEKIVKTFRYEIIHALKADHSVVENPGKGVLRVRVAITDILSVGSNGTSRGIVEAEFIDTYTHERIAAVLTSDKGMTFIEWATMLKDRLVYLKSETKTYQFK